ncbi:MAG: DUF1292 domain-containing protein [Ruminococcus sp.]|nr:DUF1292 domain-containing protein [Ruminococcus sp.]
MNDFDDNDEYFNSEEVQELMAEIAEEFMSPEETSENEFITLTNEDGEPEEFMVLGVVEYMEKPYIVLMPTAEDNDYNVILEIIPDEENNCSTFAPVDDDILYKVFDKFREEHAGEFNFQ